MTQVNLTLTATITGTQIIDLPDGKTWADVATFYVKWGTLYVTWRGGEQWECPTPVDYELDTIDHKRPASVQVHAVTTDAAGYPAVDWENELDAID